MDLESQAGCNEVIFLPFSAGVKVETRISHTLYDTAQIHKNNGSKPVKSLKQLQAAAKKCGMPALAAL